MFDVNSNVATHIGNHENAIKAVEYSSDVNSVITGSWDSSIKVWDIRSQQCVGTYSQPGKVYTMSLCGDKLVVGTSGRKVLVWDLRKMSYASQRRESNLKYQTRCIRCFPNKQGTGIIIPIYYSLASINLTVRRSHFHAFQSGFSLLSLLLR